MQELAASCVQKLEAALESAISRIPVEVTKALTSFLSRAPSLCRTLADQNRPPRCKLRFMNGLSNEVFTKKGICAENGDPLKISVVDNNQQVSSSHRLHSAKIKIVVLDGDFSKENEEGWTSEDFSKHIVRPRDKVGAVLTGEVELSLKNGEACLLDATFIDNSKFTRSGKFRLGVMVIDELGERVQEGITEPFTVKDRRGEGSRKHNIPSLDDDVWRLKKISKDGVFHEALKGSDIFSVKDFLRLYYKDEHTLRKILTKARELVWKTIVGHAKMCDPGKELYSFFVEGNNVMLFFDTVYRIVGATLGDHYTPFSELDKPTQDLVGQWRNFAYENIPHRQPDYEMDNGKPRPINQGTFQGSSMLEAKLTDVMKGHIGQENRNAHETVDQQGNSGSDSKQCTLKRLGSMRVTQNDEDASFDIRFFLDSGSEQYYASTAANEITGSVTLHCPTTAANEITGSVELKQASLAMDNEAYDIPFANNDASAPQLCQEQPVLDHFDASSLYPISALADVPMYSRHSSFKENCHEMLALGADQPPL